MAWQLVFTVTGIIPALALWYLFKRDSKRLPGVLIPHFMPCNRAAAQPSCSYIAPALLCTALHGVIGSSAL